MSKLGDALRKKYRTPREALKALGLDEKLLDSTNIAFDGAPNMTKPTRLEYAALMRTAKAVNPLLAMDAKVNYAPIFKGLTTKNFKQRRPMIMDGLKKAIAGKTIAKDASLEHVAEFLNKFEHTPPSEKSWDESVSGPQHRAMEAAAHGHSNLDIPKNVGEEFEHKDKGKTFGDMIKDWAKDKGLSEDDLKALDQMHCDAMPGEEALDEEETNIEVEEGEDDELEEEEAEDGEIEEEEGEDALPPRDRRGARDKKGAKDRKAAKDRKGAMDKRPITQDEMTGAIAAATKMVQKQAREATEARAFVRPHVGEVSLALDSAEQIYRSAAKAMKIEDADKVHYSALRQLISLAGKNKQMAEDHSFLPNGDDMALDSGGESAASFDKFFPGAARIGTM